MLPSDVIRTRLQCPQKGRDTGATIPISPNPSRNVNRRAVSLRQAAVGLFVTILTALALIKLPLVAHAFGVINDAVGAISSASRAGTSFVFGYLGGGTLPYDLKVPGAEFVLALQALPLVLIMSVLTTLLFYWRILPPIVRGFAWLLERTLGVGGAVGLSTAANIFLGMVEAPLFIRPYLAALTRSELFIVMTGLPMWSVTTK